VLVGRERPPDGGWGLSPVSVKLASNRAGSWAFH
jgi:hypothetical protein